MTSIKTTARVAGVLYLVMSLLMIFGFMYLTARFVVIDDAAATMRRIAEGATIYRLGLVSALAAQLLFVFVVLTLYRLFEGVDRPLARLMVALVCVGVAGEIVNLANRTAPLVLLSGADALSGLTQVQREALALLFLRVGVKLGQILASIWGLWLFPLGALTIRSGFLPRILGILLFGAGVAYCTNCVVAMLFPDRMHAVSQLLMPLYFAELPLVFWLVIKGAKAPERRPAS